MIRPPTVLRLPAIEVRQTTRRRLYTFAVDGKQLTSFTAVSRLYRDDQARLGGYQRPEVMSHIAGIRAYLESSDPVLPNALVVAFDRRVAFTAHTRSTTSKYSQIGELHIPIDPAWSEAEKPGWVVDGQQRLAAVREARVRQFPLCVTAFITESTAEQRTQFILVNSTKPLPKGLIYELLPDTKGVLPRQLRNKVIPARLLDHLNHDRDSPLRSRISTPTTPEGVIKDNSILRMLENSLSDGALYTFRDAPSGSADIVAMLEVIKAFWEAVESVFPEAFGKPPRQSRLMHGVGVISLGFLMDAIADDIGAGRRPTTADFRDGLRPLVPVCHWTSGSWDIDGVPRRWNDLQNVPRDIQMVADHLRAQYRRRVVGRRRMRVVAS